PGMRPPRQHPPPRLVPQPLPFVFQAAQARIAGRQAGRRDPQRPAVHLERVLRLPVAPFRDPGPQTACQGLEFLWGGLHAPFALPIWASCMAVNMSCISVACCCNSSIMVSDAAICCVRLVANWVTWAF